MAAIGIKLCLANISEEDVCKEIAVELRKLMQRLRDEKKISGFSIEYNLGQLPFDLGFDMEIG